ncbi:uracil-DNA glycosylase-like protein [Syncephalastrum racemosum]|uniref:G/T mismatch-specific thymine DNA glycosylase n=1 Tax=Syncephalastrum racemosum TaxID=13706 RepID=A0A1X2HMC2_SYNRA|nr:uracil-DNA glycosylase-like protein [Syncephalastrum racemosum]
MPSIRKKKTVKQEEPVDEDRLSPATLSRIPNYDGVPDILDYDLRVMFVGINPGLTSAAQGHHFAGPTNHFWPCLSESGLVSRKVTFRDDMNLAKDYRLGMTNLTQRTSRKASDLTVAEQRAGIPTLTAKLRQYRPRIACFVGKGMYEIFARDKCQKLGLQARRIPWDNQQGATRLFVMPSTSGIVSAYQKEDKLKFFQELARLSDELEEEFSKKKEDKE